MKNDRPLNDRQERALIALGDVETALHPTRVAHLAGERGNSASIGAAFRNVLFALERRGLVRSTYMQTHGKSALFVITEEGRALLRSMGD